MFGAGYIKFDNFTIQFNGNYAQDFKIVSVENRLLKGFGGNVAVSYDF